MATFRVGQRVRIVNNITPESHPDFFKHIGKETTITAIFNWDAVHPYVLALEGGRWSANSAEIEPLQDDGRTVITWDACCWQPPRELETVCSDK